MIIKILYKFVNLSKMLFDKFFTGIIIKFLNEEKKFWLIYKLKYWTNIDRKGSVSGQGSDIHQTINISSALKGFIKNENIKSMLDLPCGDASWVIRAHLDLESYIGADIVMPLIIDNRKKNNLNNFSFKKINLLEDKLPYADLLFCRDCLVHLTLDQINIVLNNIKRTNFKFIALTHFQDTEINFDSYLSDRWKPINLTKIPFKLVQPYKLLNDTSKNDPQKFIAIWKKIETEN